MTFDLRLVAHSPNGPRLGVLPHPLSVEAGWPLNDVPSLKVSYAAAAAGADLLAQPCEVAVEWSADGGTVWTEDTDSRFLLIKRRGDGADATGLVRFELPGYAWMLRKVVLHPGAAALVNGGRPFLSATPGAIVQTFLAEAQARGSVPGLVWDFTPTHDSAGQPWSKILTIYYRPGIDALTTLINLADQGVLDFRASGRTLQLYNADTEMERDLASGPAPVDLRYGRDIVEAPDDGTFEDVASLVLVVGDNGLVKTYTNAAAAQPWGPWEQYVGHGGVSDEGTATLLAQAALGRAERERVQRTRGITVYGAQWLPWRDYRPGDRVLVPGAGRALESLRLRQVTLARNDRGVVGGALVLNDRFLEKELRLARRTAGIVGGSTADGGSGARPAPAPEAPEPRTPAAPQGLIVDPAAYLDEHGFPRGQVTVTWGSVTQDAGGVALNVGGYELFMRVNTTGEPWFLVASTEPTDTTATYSPLVVGTGYAFKVRAVNLGKLGPFSSVVAVTIPDDTTAPPVPTAPQLSTRLGVVRVLWDGMGVSSRPMPSDFFHVRVWMQNPLAPGWADIGFLDAAGSILVPGLPYGADRQFRFTSVDRSGNESGPSTAVTIATVPLVQGDAANESITTGALAANAVTTDKLAVGAVEAGTIAAGAVTADKLQAVLTLTSRLVAGNPTQARVELNSSGLAAYNASGQQTASISASSGAVSIVGQFASGVTGARVVVNPAGAVAPEIRFIPGSGTNQSRIYSDGSMYTGEATLVMESGTNQASTAMCRLHHAAGFWRVAILDPSNGAQRGGYMVADETQTQLGWFHPTQASQQFLMSSTGTLHRGTWKLGGADSGLIMLEVSVAGNGNYHVVNFGYTMLTVPSLVWSAQRGSGASALPAPTDLIVYSRTQSSVFFRSPTNATSATVITFSVWAWRT